MTKQDQTKADAGEQQPRRLTPSERYHELALLVAGRAQAAPEHSLNLARNRVGAVEIDLTTRGGDLAELEQQSTELFDRLCARYPRIDLVPAKQGARVES